MTLNENLSEGLHTVLGQAVVVAAGELDYATIERLRKPMLDALAGAPARLVVDLTRVSFMDSAGIHVLVEAHNQATAIQASVLLVGHPGGHVRRVLGICGLASLFEIHDTLEDALSTTVDGKFRLTDPGPRKGPLAPGGPAGA
jgi:anti-anti-sigma factor